MKEFKYIKMSYIYVFYIKKLKTFITHVPDDRLKYSLYI